jgi:hypothetical protein
MYAITSEPEADIGSAESIPRIAMDQATSPEQMALVDLIKSDLVKDQNASLTLRILELEKQLQASLYILTTDQIRKLNRAMIKKRRF